MSLIPAGSKLEANLLVPTRAAGFLVVGQATRLQVQAFPFQRFGFVTGEVRTISQSVLRPGEANVPVEYKEPVYRVRVQLDRDHVTAYGSRKALRPGMLLTADVITDRRRLWEQFFDPLIAARKRAG